jgi:hypothetical protein
MPLISDSSDGDYIRVVLSSPIGTWHKCVKNRAGRRGLAS